ncbi:MAG: hypothetical protein AAGL24_09945 [Pseudomonadota bacterium]
MILIPELKTVLILVPRTGSGSLYRAVEKTYPQSMRIYRHMEADGVPAGYDRWQRIGVVRKPVDRLWSLYNFLRSFDGPHDPAFIKEQRDSVDRPFSEWIVNNETVFTAPYDRAGGRFFPNFTVRHALPETRKSQFFYLRPDLGTYVWRFEDLRDLADHLSVELGWHNRTRSAGDNGPPALTPEAWDHVKRFLAWDLEHTGPAVIEVAA